MIGSEYWLTMVSFLMKLIGYVLALVMLLEKLQLKFVFGVVVILANHLERCMVLSFLNCFVSVTPWVGMCEVLHNMTY